MFKKCEDLSKPDLMNKSAVKDFKQQCCDQIPNFEKMAEEILPKKCQFTTCRLKSEFQVELIANEKEILFFTKENIVFPHLKLVHQYPDLLPRMQIDLGGIKHIFGGADVMCPGLTSPGGFITDNIEEQTPVAIYVEGKEHALAVGCTILSSSQIKSQNKGVGIKNLHHLNDALWFLKDFKKK